MEYRENEIIEVDGKWKLSDGNATSIESFTSYDEAVEASKADESDWEAASDMAEYEDITEITWE